MELLVDLQLFKETKTLWLCVCNPIFTHMAGREHEPALSLIVVLFFLLGFLFACRSRNPLLPLLPVFSMRALPFEISIKNIRKTISILII